MNNSILYKNDNVYFLSDLSLHKVLERSENVAPERKRGRFEARHVLCYHGTSARYANDIRAHGMRLANKGDGCTEKLRSSFGLDDKEACNFHYVTTSLATAASYANSFEEPEVIALIAHRQDLTIDPQEEQGLRLSVNVSKDCILPKLGRRIDSAIRDKIYTKLKVTDDEVKRDEVRTLIHRYAYSESMIRESLKVAISPIDKEKTRDKQTLKGLQSQGINLQNLKDGESISIDLDSILDF